jgi:NTE family protein
VILWKKKKLKDDNLKTISLVLGSGGARGYAHIGVIHELEKQGYKIKSIAGSSMGALIGGLYATGKLKEFEAWVLSLDYYEIFKLISFSSTSGGIVDAEKVFDKLKVMMGDVQIEDLPIKYRAVATDLHSQKEVLFEKGSLIDAIRASVGIPTIFSPVLTNDMILVDGGVLNPLPINAVLDDDTDLTIAVNLDANIPNNYNIIIPDEQKSREELLYEEFTNLIEKAQAMLPPDLLNIINETMAKRSKKRVVKKQDIFFVLSKTLDTAQGVLALYSMQNHKVDRMINIPRDSCEFYEFTKAYEMIEIGKMATRDKV